MRNAGNYRQAFDAQKLKLFQAAQLGRQRSVEAVGVQPQRQKVREASDTGWNRARQVVYRQVQRYESRQPAYRSRDGSTELVEVQVSADQAVCGRTHYEVMTAVSQRIVGRGLAQV